MKMTPLASKNKHSMHFCCDLERIALVGLESCGPTHCMSACFVLGSNLKTQLSSVVMMRSRMHASLWILQMLSWQICSLIAFCCSVSILGMNLGAMCRRWRSFFRILWVEVADVPTASEMVLMDRLLSCCTACWTFSTLASVLAERGCPVWGSSWQDLLGSVWKRWNHIWICGCNRAA